jgi:hypothetical protein
MMIPQAIRTAGTALKQFLTDPQSLKHMGQSIAAETAFATAAQQAVPRMLGQRPAQSIPQSLLQTGIQSAVGTPVSGALQAMGAPTLGSNITGNILGAAAANRFAGQIEPEIVQENNPDFHQLYAMQKINAAAEQQRVNDQIQLAYARNYNPPSFIYHHSSKDSGEVANQLVKNILR